MVNCEWKIRDQVIRDQAIRNQALRLVIASPRSNLFLLKSSDTPSNAREWYAYLVIASTLKG
jgi:hypothetical protein